VCFTEERIALAIFRQNLSMYLSNVYEKIDCVKNYNSKYYVL